MMKANDQALPPWHYCLLIGVVAFPSVSPALRPLTPEETQHVEAYQAFYDKLLIGESVLEVDEVKLEMDGVERERHRAEILRELHEARPPGRRGEIKWRSTYRLDEMGRHVSEQSFQYHFSGASWKQVRRDTSPDGVRKSETVYDCGRGLTLSLWEDEEPSVLGELSLVVYDGVDSSYLPGYERLEWRVRRFMPIQPWVEVDGETPPLPLAVDEELSSSERLAVVHVKKDGAAGHAVYYFDKASGRLEQVMMIGGTRKDQPLRASYEYTWESGDFPSRITYSSRYYPTIEGSARTVETISIRSFSWVAPATSRDVLLREWLPAIPTSDLIEVSRRGDETVQRLSAEAALDYFLHGERSTTP